MVPDTAATVAVAAVTGASIVIVLAGWLAISWQFTVPLDEKPAWTRGRHRRPMPPVPWARLALAFAAAVAAFPLTAATRSHHGSRDATCRRSLMGGSR